MIVGTRILYPEEIGYWNAELLQISVYRGMKDNLHYMKKSADACKKAGIRYVVHPVSYSLLQKEMVKDLREMAQCTDIALILHDEKTPEGKRIRGEYETRFRKVISELAAIAPVSFENATDTGDIEWFWDTYADSVTLDIGHIESSGFNSLEFVKALSKDILDKIQFVHMHRNNGPHGGITDHWPLTPDCRELRALEELVKIKSDVSVILEINEIDEIEDSLALLSRVRERVRQNAP